MNKTADHTGIPSPGNASRILRARCVFLFLIPLALCLFLALAGYVPQWTHSDLGWHLAQADWMIRHHSVLRYDVFNYPNTQTPLVDEYPLYQLLLWLLYQLGDHAVAIACSAVLILHFALYFHTARRLRLVVGAVLALIFTTGAALFLQRSAFRPELATTLGCAYFTSFLLWHREETDWKKFWPLAAAQVLWVNSHSGFILGPALVAAFGGEMILRDGWIQKKFPSTTARRWTWILFFTALACLVNPYGAARLALPFYHQSSQVIRAYATEMQGLPLDLSGFFVPVMLLQLALLVLGVFLYRGASWSLLAFAFLFFLATFHTQRHIGLYGILGAAAALSLPVFGRKRTEVQTNRFILTLSTLSAFLALISTLLFSFGIYRSNHLQGDPWANLQQDHTAVPISALRWIREHQIAGPLFHRCEIGGWLQHSGYNQGETFADSGLGKFPENLVHEIGLAGERPGFLPQLLSKYRPNCVIVSNLATQWPQPLRQSGWRCVFYAPNASIWLPNGVRPDLAAMPDAAILRRFDTVERQDNRVFYRTVVTLHSMGFEEKSWQVLLDSPASWMTGELYWECATQLAFHSPTQDTPPLESLLHLAEKPENRESSLLFRAGLAAHNNHPGAVIQLLAPLPRILPNDPAFTLLAEAWVQTGNFDDAARLLRRESLFELNNGRRYQLLAEVENHLGNKQASLRAARQARYFWPDAASK